MTEKELTPEEKPNLSYDWNLLGYAQVAQEYFNKGSEEGMHLAKKSLELILKDAKVDDPWIVNTVTDPKVLSKTIESQLETYNQFQKDQIVGDILDYYGADLDNYIDGGVSKAKQDLKGFVNEKYTDVISKINKAQHILKGKKEHDIGSDEVLKILSNNFMLKRRNNFSLIN
jgi:hypothetical protein